MKNNYCIPLAHCGGFAKKNVKCHSKLLSYEYFTQKHFYQGAHNVRNRIFFGPKDMVIPVVFFRAAVDFSVVFTLEQKNR